MAAIKINQGTNTVIQTVAVGGTETQVVRLDIGSGATTAEFGGTINRVTDLLKGTITAVSNLAFGTVDTFYRHPDAFSVIASTGTTDFGTIKAAVTGSVIYITDLIISAGSATNVEIGDGTVGASNIMGTLQFAQYGGMVCNFRTPVKTSSGGTLVYKQSVGCPLTITCNGFVD